MTDLRKYGDDAHYAAAAQLPRSHAYYGDHLLRPVTHDPVLLLEAARRAALAAAHEFFGIPADHKFTILTYLRIHLLRPQLLAVGASPLNLAMEVTAVDRRRCGRARSPAWTSRSSSPSAVPGSAWAGWGCGSGTRPATGTRCGCATGTAPSRRPPPGGPRRAGHPGRPHLVGRTDPGNVMLLDPELREGVGHAVLRVPADHPSYVRPPAQDHLPGMKLAEAARRLALFTALDSRGISTAKSVLVDLNVTFAKFGELEPATVLLATPGQGAAGHWGRDGENRTTPRAGRWSWPRPVPAAPSPSCR